LTRSKPDNVKQSMLRMQRQCRLMPMRIFWPIALVAALAAGCSSLLPKARTETLTGFTSFDEAKAAIDRIEPYRTTRRDLQALGIGTPGDATITLLSHVDIVGRFPLGGVAQPGDVDRGVSDCLKAGRACNGYLINVRRVTRDRIGNFWLDALAFRRETDVRGWSFNALVLFVDDLAVYAVHGGQPVIHESEVSRNPLGPLQGWGEWVIR
jgi:hypothetical protein